MGEKKVTAEKCRANIFLDDWIPGGERTLTHISMLSYPSVEWTLSPKENRGQMQTFANHRLAKKRS